MANTKTSQENSAGNQREQSADLRNSPMMAHLLDALEAKRDIGHYGD